MLHAVAGLSAGIVARVLSRHRSIVSMLKPERPMTNRGAHSVQGVILEMLAEEATLGDDVAMPS